MSRKNLKLRLRWRTVEDDVALVFDKQGWAHLEAEARTRGTSAEEMVSVAVVELIGKIVEQTEVA